MTPINFSVYLVDEYAFLGRCLEGFFFGLYSAIFAMYLRQAYASKNTLFYALCTLYVLSIATIICDVTLSLTDASAVTKSTIHRISFTIFGCCDFISQSILIYRCWIVWNRKIRVVLVPLILAFTFLATWFAGNSTGYFLSGQFFFPNWAITMNVTSLAVSMTVNALVMGLIVLKIFKVFQQVKPTLCEQNSGTNKLQSVIFILIESGMALFSIQFARLLVTLLLADSNSVYNAFELIIYIHPMLNGITPTIILVRVSMGLSFHDEDSLVEATTSLCFAVPDNPNPILETGSISIGGQESRDCDIGVRMSNGIQKIDR